LPILLHSNAPIAVLSVFPFCYLSPHYSKKRIMSTTTSQCTNSRPPAAWTLYVRRALNRLRSRCPLRWFMDKGVRKWEVGV